MSVELLRIIRGLKDLTRDSESNSQIMHEICGEMTRLAGASVYITDSQGKLLISESVKGSKQLFRLKSGIDGKYIDTRLNEQFMTIIETKENIGLTSFYIKNYTKAELNDFNALILPLYAYGERNGTMILVGVQAFFDTDVIVVAEYCSMLTALMLMHDQKEESAEESRRMNVVRSALNTLSFSELEAILRIFDELPGSEGLLVASKIADKVGITRSVIVSALRKFESAGVIESRSLGMKGTYIKVLNDVLIDELNKLRR